MENNPTDQAIRLHSDDTVAVVVQSTRRGSKVVINGPGSSLSLTARDDIPIYHKVSLVTKQPGQELMRNGIAIGYATNAINAGDWVHTHNLLSLRTHLAEGAED